MYLCALFILDDNWLFIQIDHPFFLCAFIDLNKLPNIIKEIITVCAGAIDLLELWSMIN